MVEPFFSLKYSYSILMFLQYFYFRNFENTKNRSIIYNLILKLKMR